MYYPSITGSYVNGIILSTGEIIRCHTSRYYEQQINFLYQHKTIKKYTIYNSVTILQSKGFFMKLFRQCLFLCILALPNILNATTYYANSSTGSDSYTGTSSAASFKTFTKAYTTASAGDVIILTGTFTGTDVTETASTATNGFTISKALTIQGSSSTTLAIVQAGSSLSSSTSRAVFSISANVTLKDLELRYGYIDYGGAIYEYSGYTVILNNCYLHDNYTTSKGGAIFASSCALTITGCTFANNTSIQAGGIELNTSASAVITNSTFYNNIATGGTGGALSISTACTCVITNCTIAGNTASTYGGGIEMSNSGGTVTIKNTIVANNTCTGYSATNDLDLYTGTFTDNGYNIFEYYEAASGVGSINGNTKTGNQTSLFGSSISATPSLATNNTSNGTPTLKTTSGSVVINAGNSSANGSVSIPTTDQRGASRNGSVDIGAYEYWSDAGALPVELSSFTASTANSAATLSWKTATEVNNYGFEVEKRLVGETVNGAWEKVGFVAGNGTSNTEHTYSYADANVSSGTYAYRLKQIDNDGTYKYSNEAEVTINVPNILTLANYPNPFNPTTTFSFTLVQDGFTTLKIYNVLGKEVATLVNGDMKAGITNTVTFDASKLSSGVYFSRLENNGSAQIKKLVLMK
jgi:parallel beta-helix repeat protein